MARDETSREPPPSPSADDPFAGPGEHRARCRAVDWAATPVGPPTRWPPSVRGAIQICLDARAAMAVWLGPEARLVYNEPYAEVLGRERHPDMLGRPASEVWPEVWDELAPLFDRVLRNGEAVYREDASFTLRRRPGEDEAYFTFSLTPVRDAAGAIVAALNTATETTARVHAERDVQRMFALSHDLLAVADIDDRFRRVNPAFTRVLGWSEEEMLTHPGSFFVHPEDRGRTMERVGELASGRPLFRFENRYRTKDGSYRWLSWTAAAVPDEGLIYAAARDITEAKQAEHALAASEERFRRIAEAMPQLVWIADDEGKVIYYNSRAALYGGVERDADGSWRWQPAVHPDELEGTREAWRAAVATRRTYQFEHRVKMRDGSYRWHLSRAILVPERDGAPRWFGTATDVHDLKLAQEGLREADRRKDEYLAMLGHELRNPLAAVRSAAELVSQAQNGDERLRRAAAVLDRQSGQMARLIDGLLEVSRIARGKVDIAPEPLELRDALTAVAEDRRAAVEERGLTLALSLPDEPVWVSADPVRFTQIVDNLLGNALKFTARGGITVTLGREDGRAVVRVADTGQGIRPELLDTIFEPFRQDLRAHAHPSEGLGLGLALARGLVELHGGTIEACSEGPGTGAELVFRLPRIEPPAEARRTRRRGDGVPPRRILVVEDNQDAADMLRELLELRGHRVRVAEDADEALAALREGDVEVVLCDIGLPGKSGYELARAVRAEPRTRDLTLIALTGYGQPRDRKRALEAGFDEHMTKPVDLAALGERLRELPRA